MHLLLSELGHSPAALQCAFSPMPPYTPLFSLSTPLLGPLLLAVACAPDSEHEVDQLESFGDTYTVRAVSAQIDDWFSIDGEAKKSYAEMWVRTGFFRRINGWTDAALGPSPSWDEAMAEEVPRWAIQQNGILVRLRWERSWRDSILAECRIFPVLPPGVAVSISLHPESDPRCKDFPQERRIEHLELDFEPES